MNKRVSINTIQKLKAENKIITALTAYDYSTSKAIDEAGIDIILVGDSLAMVALGYETTHQVGVEEMLVFTKAVTKGAKSSLVVVDMPFMSYHSDISKAIENAGAFIKAGAKAIKLEGGSEHIVEAVKRCVDAGIPVMAHLGFTPQFLHTIGGFNIQGKSIESTEQILAQAKELEKAGAFAIVLEMVPEEAAAYITSQLRIPTIGIGAGSKCDGQILVVDDVIGKYSDFSPKFARKYANIYETIKEAVSAYKNDVINREFPQGNEVFHISEEEKERFKDAGFIQN